MTIHNKIGAALVAAALGLAGAASADQLADIKAAGKITTATDMHYAPFDMLVDGTYQGMTKDLFDEVAKEIGVEPVYQDIPWTAELPGLEVGKFDIVIAPVTITPERLERYTFTLPIADATVGLVKAASNDAVNKPEDIAGKKVGVQQGTAQFRQLQAYGETLGGVGARPGGRVLRRTRARGARGPSGKRRCEGDGRLGQPPLPGLQGRGHHSHRGRKGHRSAVLAGRRVRGHHRERRLPGP